MGTDRLMSGFLCLVLAKPFVHCYTIFKSIYSFEILWHSHFFRKDSFCLTSSENCAFYSKIKLHGIQKEAEGEYHRIE